MFSSFSKKLPKKPAQGARRVLSAFGVTIAASTWALLSVFGIGSLIAGLVVYVGASQLGMTIDEESALSLMILSAAVYICGAAVLLIEPYAIRRMSMTQVKELIGLARLPVLKDIGFGLLAWAAYMVLTIITSLLVAQFVPGVDLDQKQDIGFTSLTNNLDIFYAFLVIVVAAPIVEEIVFRGYLYGTLRRRIPRFVAAVITSVLFAVVHGQLNVGIDVFLVSMVLCYLRDKTGSIWAGIYVHALKNSIAFYILFVAPEWLRSLLMNS